MNRGELRTRMLYALNDDPVSPVFFEASLLNEGIEDAVNVLAETGLAFRAIHQIPRRAGAMLYHIAGVGSNIQVPWRIWLPDLKRRLDPVEITDLDARHELWMTVVGDPYYWFPVDWRTFGIWPIPTVGGGIMEVDCYQWPTPLLDDGDDVTQMSLADHEMLVLYNEAEGYLRQWDTDRAMDLWQAFIARLPGATAGVGIRRGDSRDSIRPHRPYGGRGTPFTGGA